MEIEEFFTTDQSDSWERCFPIWKEAGRVEDMPHGVRYTRYTPSFGKRLGQEYASRFRDHWQFLVTKLGSDDDTAKLCAFDLLEQVAWDYYASCDDLPEGITRIENPIPERAMNDIESEHFFKEFRGTKVGDFLPFLLEHG